MQDLPVTSLPKSVNTVDDQSTYRYSDDASFAFETRGLTGKLLNVTGLSSRTGIYWSIYSPRNFGDWITPYLYFKLTGRPPFFQGPSRYLKTIFSTGSIVRRINKSNSVLVWGSGAISHKDEFRSPLKTLAVRGPLTRDVFLKKGYNCPEVYGDPGMLLPTVFSTQNIPKEDKVAIIPHFKELPLMSKLQLSEDCKLVDVTRPIERVISEIAGCSHAISSSLHGVIVSHAFKVPCAWARFSPEWDPAIDGDDIKFSDYFASIGLDMHAEMNLLDPHALPGTSELRGIALSTPLPDLASLQENLISVCPFPIPHKQHLQAAHQSPRHGLHNDL